MTVFNPTDDHALRERLQHHSSGLIVACYCAAWCDTCRAWQVDFAELASRWPAHTFVWIDIEDHPDFLGDEDIEDFPTLAIQTATHNVFFGEQLPYAAHVDRLITMLEDAHGAPASGPPLVRDLAGA